MAELDPFESRLARAIQSIADRADTRVDAVATASEAMGGHRRRRAIWIWSRRLPAPALVLLLLALSLGLVGLSALVGAMRDRSVLVVPPPTLPAHATGAPPTATTLPTGTETGAQPSKGTGLFTIVASGSTVRVGDGTQLRGFVVASTDTTTDRRTSGTGTLRLSIDTYGAVGREWGTYEVRTSEGAWLGPVVGASWNDGNESDVAGYLAGSGAYAGLTYYIHVRSTNFRTDIEGIIYPGSPPGPQSGEAVR